MTAAARLDALREAIADRFKSYWGPPVVGHPRHMDRVVERHERAARNLADEALRAIDAAGFAAVPTGGNCEMIAAFWRQKNTGTQERGATGPDTHDFAAMAAMIAAGAVKP